MAVKSVKVAVSMGQDLVGTEGQGGSTITMVLRVDGCRMSACTSRARDQE